MDLQILQWINATWHSNNFFNMFFKYITYLGESGIAWIILGLVLMLFKKTRKGGFIMLASLFVGACINNLIIKPIVARPRPFAADPSLAEFIKSIGYPLPDSTSFPSGHSQASINCALVLTIMFGWKGALAFIPALLVAFSRVFLCVHYPSDVLVGAVIGAIVALIFATAVSKLYDVVINKIKQKWQERKNTKQNAN